MHPNKFGAHTTPWQNGKSMRVLCHYNIATTIDLDIQIYDTHRFRYLESTV
jgi:hypothetical protein